MSEPRHKAYVRPAVAARLLGVCTRTVCKMIDDGRLSSRLVGSTTRIVTADLLEKFPELRGHPDLREKP